MSLAAVLAWAVLIIHVGFWLYVYRVLRRELPERFWRRPR